MSQPFTRIVSAIVVLAFAGCASGPQVAIDPKSISDTAKYKADLDECTAVAKNYDLSGNATANAAVGAVVIPPFCGDLISRFMRPWPAVVLA